MVKNDRRAPKTPPGVPFAPAPDKLQETPLEAIASICSVLVIGLFVLTFIGENFEIPSGSMEKTLLVGDHLVVDRITLAPPAKWMPLVYYREPRRGDVVVFFKPVPNPNGEYMYLVKRLIGVPGDRIHLHNGIVFINGVAQFQPHAQPTTPDKFSNFLDEFPSVPPTPSAVPSVGTPESWAVDFPSHIVDGDLVVPPDMYFMMGDNRHNSLDSRYWGFVPRANIVGRPLFNYWSFKTPGDLVYKTSLGDRMAWMGHVVLHFFTDTRWMRTLHPVR
ncbi:MAG: signal peptidase I [Terracidiphilus sp.]